jgi:segregation and condensation protein B
LETRKPPQLSQPALEVLSIIAYFQPVTRLYIEQIRGVDSVYTVGLLLDRGLIESCGRLAVPGRPLLYRTTYVFLRTFGLESLAELPELPQVESNGDAREGIQEAILELKSREGGENSE